jgi:hypothetical protein
MWPFTKDLLHRGWKEALANGSSTGISVLWLGFGVLVLGFIFTAGIEWLTGGRNVAALKSAIKSWKTWTGAASALLFAWICLWGYSTLNVAYRDHQRLSAAADKTCPKTQEEKKENPTAGHAGGPALKINNQIRQNGNGNSANPGTITGPVHIDPCSVLQNGGSGNQANVECPPPLKITASVQAVVQTGNPEKPYASIFTISTNIPAQIGDFRFTCTGPVVSANIDRISEYEISTGNIGPDPADPNTLVYQVKPEPLNPNHFVTVRIFSKAPLQVISGKAGDYPITFTPQ